MSKKTRKYLHSQMALTKGRLKNKNITFQNKKPGSFICVSGFIFWKISVALIRKIEDKLYYLFSVLMLDTKHLKSLF